jgi:hypothetical protein
LTLISTHPDRQSRHSRQLTVSSTFEQSALPASGEDARARSSAFCELNKSLGQDSASLFIMG